MLLCPILKVIIEFALPLLSLTNEPYSNGNNTNRNLKSRF